MNLRVTCEIFEFKYIRSSFVQPIKYTTTQIIRSAMNVMMLKEIKFCCKYRVRIYGKMDEIIVTASTLIITFVQNLPTERPIIPLSINSRIPSAKNDSIMDTTSTISGKN